MLKKMNRDEFVEQLKKLTSFTGLAGDVEENRKALDYVAELAVGGVKMERFQNGNAEVLMMFSSEIKKDPDYCYMVHMDVVAGRSDQFVMRVEGDKLIGRGTCDMKFSIPIGIALLNEAVSKGIDFCVMITTDEEIGGFEGAKKAADDGFAPKVLIVPDGGENLNFVDRAKGVCQLKIVASGKPAHASRPWLGNNAIEPLMLLGCELLKKYGESNKSESWKTTMNIGTINGGISTNQVCPLAEMKLDFRYPETDSIKNIEEEVRRLADKLGISIEISKLSTGLPTFTDVDDPIVKKYLSVMEKTFGKKITVKPTYGASDARHFAHLKCPVIMHKPLGGEIHSDDEWVSLESCMKFYQGMREFLGIT